MLRWKSSLKPAAAAPPSGGTNPGTSNLVAWLGMDEGSGNSVDDSTSNNNNFTKTNGSWVTGKVGNYAVRLDGSGDYISSDSALTIGSKICTVSFWMYWTKVGSGEKYLYELGNRWWQTDGSITLKWDQANTRFLVAMQDSTSGTKYLELAFPEPSDGQWVYVTVVYNNSTNAGEIKLYYDGTAQSSSSTISNNKDQASNFTSSTLFIGANSTGNEEITADLDTFAIFSDELTQDEITWMYNSGNGRSYSDVSGATDYRSTILADNPLFYYRLGESSGATTAYDEVATASNGTYYNTPTLGQTGAVSGDSNTCVLLEQANSEYVEGVTLSSQTSLLPCTMECFIKLSGASDSNAGIFFYRSGSYSASGLNIRGGNFGSLGYHWKEATFSWQFNSGITLSADTWYYVALVVKSTQAKFYVIDESGTLTTAEKNETHSSLDCSNDGWHLGRDPITWNARYFEGYIDEAALYNQELSQSTIVAHAAAAGFSSSTPAGDALILNGITSSSTGGVETTMETDGSSTVYGSYAIGDMHFRDASKNGSWTDDGFGLLWDQSTDGSNWQTLLGSTSGTFYIYEQGTTTLIFSYAWSGEGNFTGNTHRYGSTSVDFTGTVPAGSTRVDVYHVKD